MGQINTNNYPTVNSLLDADLLIVENATNGTGTTTPKQLRENAIGTDTLQTSSQTVTGAINELKGEIDAGAGVVCYDVDTITSGYLGGQFSGSANLLLLHLTTDGTADSTNGYMMLLSYTRPVARFAYGRLVDTGGAAYKQDVYADNTIICKISDGGTGTESDPKQVVILGIINAGFMLTPTAVVSDRDIIDGQGNTLSVLAEALTKTASGNPVVITDCAGGKARSLITEINAIQDLHGYDHPWAGGAGKNKYVGSPSFDGYVNPRDSWVKQTETYNGHEVYKKSNEAWSGIYKRFYLPVGTYTFSVAVKTSGNGDGVALFTVLNTDEERAIGNDLNKNTTATDSWTVISNTFTITTAGYVCPRIEKTDGTGDIYISEYQLESGSSATSFAPYSNICPISGRTAAVITRSDGDEISEDFTIQLGTTVYGADINWDTGELTVTDAIVDLGTLYWEKSAGAVSGVYRFFTVQLQSLIKDTASTASAADLLSSDYPAISFNDANNGAYGIYEHTNKSVGVCDSRYYDVDITEFRSAMSGVKLCYSLATPTTIQLTPTQLEMLKGYNRVTIESGSIELGYIAKLT